MQRYVYIIKLCLCLCIVNELGLERWLELRLNARVECIWFQFVVSVCTDLYFQAFQPDYSA